MPTQSPVKPKKTEIGLLPAVLFAAAVTAAAIGWASYTVDSAEVAQTAHTETDRGVQPP